MLYIDSSSFIKLFLSEPESAAVDTALESESLVIISSLTQLETETQFRAAMLSGRLTKRAYSKVMSRYEEALGMDPFVLKGLPGSVFVTALRVHREHPDIHCRSLDRMHLAAMHELGAKRIMCHDARMCEVAKSLGYEVLTPIV